MKKLDRSTVESVQLTSPRVCKRDADRLQSELERGRIFGAFTEQEREEIWERLLAVSTDRLIPSLFTFFEDARWLRGLADGMRRLMCGPDHDASWRTLKHSFSGANQNSNVCKFQVSDSELEIRLGNVDDQIDMGYRQVWISLMRENEGELAKSAVLAIQLGFVIPQLNNLVQRSASQAAGLPRKIHHHQKTLMRCGIPRDQDQQRDKTMLFADNLHGQVGTEAGITSFFVRRSVYLAFFGQPRRMRADHRVIGRLPIAQLTESDTRHRELQQQRWENRVQEQTELAQLRERLKEARHELAQLANDRDAQDESRKDELERKEKKLTQLASHLAAQTQANEVRSGDLEQRQLALDERERSLHSQQEHNQANEMQITKLEQKQEQLSAQKQMNETEKHELERKHSALREHERSLQAQQVQNQLTRDQQQAERQRLDRLSCHLDVLKKGNESKKEQIERRQEELDRRADDLKAQEEANEVEKGELELKRRALVEREQSLQASLQLPERAVQNSVAGEDQLIQEKPQEQQENLSSPGQIAHNYPLEQKINGTQAKRMVQEIDEDEKSYSCKKPRLESDNHTPRKQERAVIAPRQTKASTRWKPGRKQARRSNTMEHAGPSSPDGGGGNTTQKLRTSDPPVLLHFTGVLQQEETATEGSQWQQVDDSSATSLFDKHLTASQVCIEFRIFSGETWEVDKKVSASLADPEPVKRAARAYQRDDMALSDSSGRLLDIETCLDDIVQNGSHAIFLHPSANASSPKASMMTKPIFLIDEEIEELF